MKIHKLEVICLGHITQSQNHRCKGCKLDQYNQWCENYYPITRGDFYVYDDKKECGEELLK
jgi:hypothetical protein